MCGERHQGLINIWGLILLKTVHKELYIGSYRKRLPQFKATMPPHKWVDNAELSVPDQMTNITEKTRLQSYLQLSRGRPNTQDKFNTLAFTVWIRAVACGIAQCCPGTPCKPKCQTVEQQQQNQCPASSKEACNEQTRSIPTEEMWTLYVATSNKIHPLKFLLGPGVLVYILWVISRIVAISA